MRRIHFIKSRAYTRYGERCLSFVIPTLLEDYCYDFINKEHPRKIKENVKMKLIQENAR